jgi:Spy/CpxP family protein refolding chaperone
MSDQESRSTLDRQGRAGALLSGGIAMLLLLLLTTAPGALAQGTAGTGMRGPGPKAGGMGTAMHPGPARHMGCHLGFYLPFADRLNLTAEQMKSLESIRFDFEKQSISRRASIATAALDVQHAENADSPDDAKIEQAIRDLYAKKTDQAIAAYRAEAKATKVLTPEQRAEAKKLSLAACGMGPHGMMMHGGMMGGIGGMHGGPMHAPMHGRRAGGGMMGGTRQGQVPQATPRPGPAD